MRDEKAYKRKILYLSILLGITIAMIAFICFKLIEALLR